jgi:hypothetical protein
MYAVFLRSQREPILVDDIVGMKLKDQWMNNKLPKRVEVGEWAGDSDQIKGIKSNATPDLDDEILSQQRDNSTKTNEYFKQVDQEYESYRNQKLKLAPAERAKIMTVVDLVWKAHTIKPMPDDLREFIIERQKAYFEEHPNHAFANPVCYRDLVEPYSAGDIDVWHGSLMRLAESVCAADKRESRKVTFQI